MSSLLTVYAGLLLGIYAMALTVIGFRQGKYIGRGLDIARAENPALFWFLNIGQFLFGVVVVVMAISLLSGWH